MIASKEAIVASQLQSISSVPMAISWHENGTSFLSYSKRGSVLHLRLHRLFLEAPSPVLEALVASIVKKNKGAMVIVRKMAHLYFSNTRKAPHRLHTLGKVYDLQLIYDRIKKEFFSPEFDASIGWSNRARVNRFRSITFGTYDRHRHQVRIHPILDNIEVPLCFVEFVVYHEMLHAICPARIDERGFCRSHTAAFRALEKKFPDYEKAKEWERSSLTRFRSVLKRKRCELGG